MDQTEIRRRNALRSSVVASLQLGPARGGFSYGAHDCAVGHAVRQTCSADRSRDRTTAMTSSRRDRNPAPVMVRSVSPAAFASTIVRRRRARTVHLDRRAGRGPTKRFRHQIGAPVESGQADSSGVAHRGQRPRWKRCAAAMPRRWTHWLFDGRIVVRPISRWRTASSKRVFAEATRPAQQSESTVELPGMNRQFTLMTRGCEERAGMPRLRRTPRSAAVRLRALQRSANEPEASEEGRIMKATRSETAPRRRPRSS